jgi:tRNA (cmo5U34)-methyltransferase
VSGRPTGEDDPAARQVQDAVVAAVKGLTPRRVLDVGAGAAGLEARVLDAWPSSCFVGGNGAGADAELPAGPFDLVLSAWALQALGPAEKAELFRRVRGVLRPGGRFVVADVIPTVSPDGADGSVESRGAIVRALQRAGLHSRVAWAQEELAVIAASRPG